MKYRNVQTGEVRNFNCTISGKMWEPIKAPVPVDEVTEKKPVKKTIKKVR